MTNEPIIAIDPGETCGVAAWINRLELMQVKPDDLYNYLQGTAPIRPTLVVEEFRLYPWENQEWNTFPTVEVIGVLKYLAKQWDLPIVMQPATVKKAALKVARGKGVKLLQPAGGGQHQKDAELHLFKYLVEQGIADHVKEWVWVNS